MCKTQKLVTLDIGNPLLQVCNINNDTTVVELEGEVSVLVFINEPSCTGCKEYLAKYPNTLSKKYRQYIILGKSESILDKKSYRNYLDLRFKKTFGTYYSMNDKNITIKVNYKDYSFDTTKNPFVMVISEMGNVVEMYDYQEIFENVFVKESFKKSMKSY